MSNLQGTAITWLGHACVHVQTYQGTSILIDPFIQQNPTFPRDYKLPEKIDLLLITHGHFDHIADALPVAQEHNPTVLGAMELIHWLTGKGMKKGEGMNLGGSFHLRDVTVTMVEAKHSSGIQDGDQMIYGGNPGGFILGIEGGPTLYHAGDTSVFSDMQLTRDLYAPDLAMLPIGGHFTMGPKEAALAAKYLGVNTVLPLHFGTFPVLTGTPEQLEEALRAHGATEIKVLKVKAGDAIR